MRKTTIAILLATNLAFGDCAKTLQACDLYVQALERENAALGAFADTVEEQRDEALKLYGEEASRNANRVEWYWYVLGGTVAGFILGRSLR